MSQHLFIGIDGGATKCTVRIEDEEGHIIGQESCGPANIRLSVHQAWESIYSSINKVLQQHAFSLSGNSHYFHAGMGLAGCEVTEAYQAFLSQQHAFASLVVTSDAHTACLGAHSGQDGAIIIAGTGVVGFQVQQGKTSKISGWGFPHDDQGSGAWLGLEAMKLTLQALDGRLSHTELTRAVFTYFKQDAPHLVDWANQANSTAFAELAPLVIQHASQGDPSAIQLLQFAAHALDRVGDALLASQPDPHQPLPCALIGGVAPFIEPHLGHALRARLRPSQAAPEVGAILLVRNHLKVGS